APPGRSDRTPNSSLPEPARGAARLACSSCGSRRMASDVKRGKTSATSESAYGRRPVKKPRGSLVLTLQPVAPTGPRRSSLTIFMRRQPFFGTRPAPNSTRLPLSCPSTLAGPRDDPLVCNATSSSRASPSKTGAIWGALRSTLSGRSSAGEPLAGTLPRTASCSHRPARFHHAYAAAATTNARIHAASRNSHGTSDVAPYHSRTSHNTPAPRTRQVGLRFLASVLAQRRDREGGNHLSKHVSRVAAAFHPEAVGEHRRGEKLHVVRQNEIPALEQRPGLRGALEVNAGAHARGQQHVRPRPDGLHQGDDVGANRGRRDHAQACLLELDHLAHVDDRGKVGDGITVLAPGEDLHRFGVRRRTHLGREHEAVELRLGQRIRAVELGGVLRRHHEEWALE